MSAPNPVQGDQVAVIFYPEFLKEQINTGIDSVVDNATPIAKQALTTMVNTTLDKAAAPIGTCTKQAVGRVVASDQAVIDVAVDGCINEGKEQVQGALIPMTESCVTSTAEVSKRSLKTAGGYSVDSSYSAWSWFTGRNIRPAQ